TVQPLAYARGLARAAAEAGARIHENSPVTGAEFRGGTWIIRTPRGTVRARALLVATNAYHRPVRQVAVPRVPVVQFFQLATEPLGHNLAGDILPGGEGCWDTGLIMSSVRRDAAGRLILGGMGGEAALHEGWARRKLTRLFPQLDGAAISHAWAGRISMTSDHLPRILRVAPRAAYAVFGYSGRGIAPGTVFGQAAARALLNGNEDGLPVMPVDSHGEVLPGLKTAVYEAGARIIHAISARR
uniref:NAD(P)/FAD-dependent oxidoreductase n=1 Tax=Roseovarius halophilus (ex Wu et al. 2025) TaxID=3376060 RepID=UPI00399ADB2C